MSEEPRQQSGLVVVLMIASLCVGLGYDYGPRVGWYTFAGVLALGMLIHHLVDIWGKR